MRPLLITLFSVLALSMSILPATAIAPSAAISSASSSVLQDKGPGAGGFLSDNMTYHGTLAADSSGIGARVHVMPDGERRFYVSGAQGLSIYNIDNPAVPVLLGRFEIPNFENEDVAVSNDGKTVLMSEFTSTAYYYVFTVSDPLTITGQVLITLEGQMVLEGAHIVDCIDDACDYSYGSDGQIYDLTDKSDPKLVGSWITAINNQRGFRPGGGHNVEVVGDYDWDGDGDLDRILTTDTTPIVMLDVSDPLNPIYISQSVQADHAEFGTKYQHNTKLLNLDGYTPRDTEDGVTYDADGKPTNLRTGEIMLGNGETNFGPRCGSGSGPLTSWSTANWEEGQKFEAIEVFRPESGTYDGNGNPAANGLGCSGHWFDTRSPTASEIAAGTADANDIMVAAGWYEHGTRVFHVDGDTGAITQLAYFQPVAGSSSAAYWVVNGERTYIYTVDYVRGGDLLRYDGATPTDAPSYADRAMSWTVADASMTRLSEDLRLACFLATGQQ